MGDGHRPGRQAAGRQGQREVSPGLPVISTIAAAAVASACLLAAVGGCAQDPSYDWDDLDGLPFRLEFRAGWGYRENRGVRPAPPAVFADADGDGRQELFQAEGATVTGVWPRPGGSVVVWQEPLPPPFHAARPVAELCADFDLQGDGRPEIVAVGADAQRRRFRAWVLDARTGATLAACNWSPPPEAYPDGRSDVWLSPLGGVQRPDAPGQWLIALADGGYDRTARAVMALDPRAGTVVWQRALGPRPDFPHSRLHDTDGDGRREIIVSGRGVGNREARVNGAADDSSHVFVLGADGQLRWQRAMMPAPSGCMLDLADLDGDGVQEIVAASGSQGAGTGVLVVLEAAFGAIRQSLRVGWRPVRVMAVPGAGRDGVLVSYLDGKLARYDWAGGTLRETAATQLPGSFYPHEIARLPGLAGRQIVGALHNSGTLVLDEDLRPLAFAPFPEGQRHTMARDWEVAPGDHRLLISAHPGQHAYLVPVRSAWPALGAASGAAALLAGGVYLRRRRRTDDPAVVREHRRQLLDRLQVLRHEKFGTLENLGRLRWHCQAICAGRRTDQAALAPVAQLVQDTRGTTLARLRRLLALARQARVQEHRVASLAESVAALDALLDRVDGATVADLEGLVADLQTVHRALEIECERVRRDAESDAHTPLLPLVAGVLRAQAPTLEEAGVSVHVAGEAIDPAGWTPSGGPTVVCDADDLGFVLDNLVGNGIRAMAGMDRRELHLSWEAAAGRCLVVISDTGCGIPPDDWDRVLAGEASTRPGGGFGLARSQESLRRYRARLRIATSEPGRGTSVTLELHEAPAAPAHPAAEATPTAGPPPEDRD